jgi:hypothetical protein
MLKKTASSAEGVSDIVAYILAPRCRLFEPSAEPFLHFVSGLEVNSRSLADLPRSGLRPSPHSLRESVAGGTQSGVLTPGITPLSERPERA